MPYVVEHFTDRWRGLYDEGEFGRPQTQYATFERALNAMRIYLGHFVLVKPTCRIVDLETGAFIMDDLLVEQPIGDIR